MYLCEQGFRTSNAQRHPILTPAGAQTGRVRVVTHKTIILIGIM